MHFWILTLWIEIIIPFWTNFLFKSNLLLKDSFPITFQIDICSTVHCHMSVPLRFLPRAWDINFSNTLHFKNISSLYFLWFKKIEENRNEYFNNSLSLILTRNVNVHLRHTFRHCWRHWRDVFFCSLAIIRFSAFEILCLITSFVAVLREHFTTSSQSQVFFVKFHSKVCSSNCTDVL